MLRPHRRGGRDETCHRTGARGLRRRGDGAAFYSAAKLHEVCTAKDETRILLSACVGYVTGAFDFFVWRKGACVPETVSMAHLTDLVMTYLQEHPEKRDLVAAEIVAAVTKDNWPCPN